MSNPYSKLLIGKKMQESVASIKRLDEKGSFYYMECTGNYYGAISVPIKALGLVKKGGCSAFTAKTPEGDVITGRNYDMPHFDDDKNVMGVNIVMHCKPEGKYESLSGVDSVWLSSLGIKVTPGCFDDGKTKLTGLSLMPYLSMDGMNEKGFTVSVLYLDIKDGEKAVQQNVKGKKKVIIICPAWGVRGHYRHYKNGKVVFISPYTKGKDRNNYQPKEYGLFKPTKGGKENEINRTDMSAQ